MKITMWVVPKCVGLKNGQPEIVISKFYKAERFAKGFATQIMRREKSGESWVWIVNGQCLPYQLK